MNEPVTIQLTADEALVLFEWLAANDSAQGLPIAHEAEQVVLWGIECQLEKALVAPLQPDYGEQLAAARERIAATQR